MLAFLNPFHYRLGLPIATIILLATVTATMAQDALPDLMASPQISPQQKAQFSALEQQLSQLAGIDEHIRRKAEQMSQRRLALRVADVSEALLQQAQVDTERARLRRDEIAHRRAASQTRKKALFRVMGDLGTRVQLLQNPARQQEENSWYRNQLELEQQALTQVKFDIALEQKRLDLLAIRLRITTQLWEMAQLWERRIQTLMRMRSQQSSVIVRGELRDRLDLENTAAYDQFLALNQQLKREAETLSQAQYRHLERKTELALDRSFATAQKVLINHAAEILTDMESFVDASAKNAKDLRQHYRRVQQLQAELASLAEDTAHRVEVFTTQRRLTQQRLGAGGEDRELVNTELTLVKGVLAEFQQIQADVGRHRQRAEEIGQRLRVRYEETRRAELVERRPFLLTADYRATLGSDFAKTPELLLYQIHVSLMAIVKAIDQLSPRDLGVVLALGLGVIVALIAFWYGSDRLETRLEGGMAASTFGRIAQTLVQLLRMNLLGIGLVLVLVALTRMLWLAPPSEEIVLTLTIVGVGTKLANNLMWLLVAHPGLPQERRPPGVYRRFGIMIWVSGSLVAVLVLGHLSDLPHSVLDALDRLFMGYLLLITPLMFRLGRLAADHLLGYYGRRYWVYTVNWVYLLIPIPLAVIGSAGVLGYLNLAWTGLGYLLIFSAVLLGWRLSQRLLYDLGNWFKQRAFQRSRKEWIAIRRVVDALQRVGYIALLLLAVLLLIRFFSLDAAIIRAWTIMITAVIVVVALYEIVFVLADLGAERSEGKLIGKLVNKARKPLGLILPIAVAQITLPRLALPEELVNLGGHALALLQITAITWLFLRLLGLLDKVSEMRYRRNDIREDLVVRRARTQLGVLRQALHVTVIIIGIGAMLMTFPAVRQFGAGLLASAGAAGLVIGIAARPLFENLIAGIQIGLTQPIRLDDVVIVEGEWGTIEEINATYVVVKIWDDRRLVVPLKYFNEHPFQHWSRKSTELLGSAFFNVDYSFPVEEGRKALKRILEQTDLWDGRYFGLQVTDFKGHLMELRVLATASDASKAWDLRCYIREKLIEFIQQNYPESLPLLRTKSATDREASTTLKSASGTFVSSAGPA